MMLYALLAAVLVAADQWLKWWTISTVGGATFDGAAFAGVWLAQPLDFIPGLLGLNFATNTGAAWSLLADHTWLLTFISAAASVAVAVALWRRVVTHWFGLLSLTLILAGAVGNLIDRVRLGYVVDMFQTLFVSFPIFNVADMCVVVGGVSLCVYILFFYDTNESPATPREEPPHDP